MTLRTLSAGLLATLGLAMAACHNAPMHNPAFPSSAAQYTNPILPGDWSDPAMIRVGDDYYTCRSSFGWQPGIPIAHSRDLLHWEYIGHAFTTLPFLAPGDTRSGIWGLDMGYNPNNGHYLIYAPTRAHDVYVFDSDHPAGPYRYQKLGSDLGIDPGFFADDDGRLYLILSSAAIYELQPDGLSIKRRVVQLDHSQYRLFEGPDIFKHNGWYYVLFSDGGTLPHEPSTISTLRARSIEGPWEPDPHNPVMFATNVPGPFEAPAHGTLIDTPSGEWFLTYHAQDKTHYSLGREMLMQPVEWTPDGWWRPTTGKVPTLTGPAPHLPPCDYHLAQSDDFTRPTLGLQWFFTCAPDLTGNAWSLTESPGHLRIRTQPGDLGAISALPGIFQQRFIDKQFSIETAVTFDAQHANEAAGLHLFHDPGMNLWLATTVHNGQKQIQVGKYNLGQRTNFWSAPNPFGNTVHLKIAVDANESATFYFGPDGHSWTRIGDAIYFGASGHHLRDNRRGDPDLGWVGRYKDHFTAPVTNPAQLARDRSGNLWTAATFGLFAVRDGATASRNADFDYIHVGHSAANMSPNRGN